MDFDILSKFLDDEQQQPQQHVPLDVQLAQRQQAAQEEYNPIEKMLSAVYDPTEEEFKRRLKD